MSLPWKFGPKLVGKYALPAFFVYVLLYFNRREHKPPYVWAPHQLHLVVEVFRVHNKPSAIFFECKPF